MLEKMKLMLLSGRLFMIGLCIVAILIVTGLLRYYQVVPFDKVRWRYLTVAMIADTIYIFWWFRAVLNELTEEEPEYQ